MAGYGTAERKMVRNTKTNLHVCGDCGEACPKGDTLCPACADEIFFNTVSVQVETEGQ